jgi:hypothetical protein
MASLNSIHASYKSGIEVPKMNVPLSKTGNIKRKGSKKSQHKSISGVSAHQSQNTSISQRNYLNKKSKNKLSEIVKGGSGGTVLVKHNQTKKMKPQSISHMSNSPIFHKANKPRQPLAKQVKKPNFGRSASEPVKEPIKYHNMLKVGRKRSECVGGVNNLGINILKNQNKSVSSDHTKSVLPTPTIKLNLGNADLNEIFTDMCMRTMEVKSNNRITIENIKQVSILLL